MNLENKNVVIIGGSSGMGLATARLAKSEGAQVTIAGRSDHKLALATKQLGDIRNVVADVTNETEIQALFQELDRVDHVFLPAGRMLTGKMMETDLDTFRADIEQRFWGALYVVRAAVPKMRDGSITFLTGQYSSKPPVGAVVTAAILSALETLAKGLALELAPIRFNVVAPGLIDTPMLGEHRESAKQWAEADLPVKRMGLAEEVAQAAVPLMTNEFITGEVLHIDGGGRLL